MRMTSEEMEASTLLADSCNNNMEIASTSEKDPQPYTMEQASYLTTSFSLKEDNNGGSSNASSPPGENGPTCPLIKSPAELSTPADKIKTVPCRQIPGSPDMSPVMKRRRTALAKKAMELQRDGKVTRIRVVGSASVILEFCDAKELQSNVDNMSCSSTTDGTCRSLASSESWQRYRSPTMRRRQIQTNSME